jgi:hypothetical protein
MAITKDLHIYESGNGGEMLLLNGDLTMAETLYQTIYIALFGGNVEQSTLGNENENDEIVSVERFDYWANALLWKDSKSKQFNSETEKTLRNVTTNSLGRLKVKSAVDNDLVFLKKIVNFESNVLILGVDKIKIQIIINEIQNQSNRIFQFVWDNAKQELILDKTI